MLELWELFQKGGIVMYPLLACSFAAVAIFIERLLYYKSSLITDERWQELVNASEGEELAKILQIGSDDDVSLVVSYYLTLPQEGINRIQALETKVNVLMGAYEEKIGFLNIIVTLAPLLGLLGTILGMISSFKVFDLSASQPFAITSGIGEALIATAFGLVVAIFTLFLYGILKYYISVLNKKLELCCLLLLGGKF